MTDMREKERFLNKISHALGRSAVPTTLEDAFDYTQGRQYSRLRGLDDEGLRACFEAEATVRDFIYCACTRQELANQLKKIIEAETPKNVVCPVDTAADGIDLLALLESLHAPVFGYEADAEPNAQRARIADADLGITIPQLAIADTGTYIEWANRRSGKIVSLLPKVHIALIYQSRLRATMTDTMQELEALYGTEAFPSYFMHVSGPSSTGDIANILVTGVHGPTKEYYLSLIHI